jgi:uncharacterized protein (TIGR03437 family)
VLRYCCLLALLAGASAKASTDLTLNFSGVTSQILQGHSGTGSAPGTITPFGTARADVSANGLDVVTVSITISLPNGDFFQATTESASGAGNTVSGTATIIGATGQFAGVSGALNFILTFAPAGTSGTFTLTGYGSLGLGQQTLVVSQNGVRFQAAAGTSAPPTQTVFVSNPGTGSLAFTASATTLSGNPTWLSAAPAAGMSTAAAPAAINISVNPTGLAPGNYYGRVDIAAPGASSSPQLVEVVFNVLAAGTNTGVLIAPTGLVFVARSGSNPAAQIVQVANPSNLSYALSTQTIFQQGSGWFSATPSTGTIQAAQTLALSVSVNTAGLMPGIYNGTLQIQIAGAPTTYPVAILLILLPAVPTPQFQPKTTGSGACTATQLIPVFTLLGNSFQTPAAWPAPLQVKVVDDCGQPMIAGSVRASFSTGEPVIELGSIGAGQWAGTWAPHNTAGGQATVTVKAQVASPALAGTAQVSGNVTPNLTTPVINAVGVVSAASFSNVPIAPGSFISIFGSNLAAGMNSSTVLPLATNLGGTLALLGGELLPLQFTSTGQINAIVPYDVPVGGTQQLLVQQDSAYSLPESLSVAPAQPAVFTQDQSGQGAGVIVVVKPDQTQFLATPATPASAGDALVIYCAGLGAVTPPIPAGSAAPLIPLSMTATATVMIGGQPAQVLFSGLSPGFAGLYQVNVVVPSGIAPDAGVNVIVAVAGMSSPPVTVAIR